MAPPLSRRGNRTTLHKAFGKFDCLEIICGAEITEPNDSVHSDSVVEDYKCRQSSNSEFGNEERRFLGVDTKKQCVRVLFSHNAHVFVDDLAAFKVPMVEMNDDTIGRRNVWQKLLQSSIIVSSAFIS